MHFLVKKQMYLHPNCGTNCRMCAVLSSHITFSNFYKKSTKLKSKKLFVSSDRPEKEKYAATIFNDSYYCYMINWNFSVNSKGAIMAGRIFKFPEL